MTPRFARYIISRIRAEAKRVFHLWLIEFFDGEFQLVAFFQIKAVSDFFWDRDDTPLSQFRVAFHLPHAEPYRLEQYNAVGLNPGVKSFENLRFS